MKIKIVFQFVLSIVLPLAIGGFSGYLTANEINDDWFVNVIKPPFNPPNYLFGPVWTMLYILMGVSLFMVVRMQRSELRTNAILAFGLQLFLNFWWSIFFFRFHRPDVALMEIVILWFSILFMISSFYKLKPFAAYIQVPYLLWVSFASILNASLWWLNK
jgi:benzodiazapine receptor